jgi:hypothetical protein
MTDASKTLTSCSGTRLSGQSAMPTCPELSRLHRH